MKFHRIKHHTIDLEQMHLVNTDKGTLHKFDFKSMVMSKISPQGQTLNPIRYDEETDAVVVWKQRRWQAIEDGKEAILFMFNARIENEILNDA